jgi:hypothetical protein
MLCLRARLWPSIFHIFYTNKLLCILMLTLSFFCFLSFLPVLAAILLLNLLSDLSLLM